METIKIKQVRSRIRCPKDQKAALNVLGLTKLNRVKELPRTPAVMGNIHKVRHLIQEVVD
ncbi:MAG: 50S ribosomal protein L30 [Porphyromonas sp.]|nr:50S ribosomal protein L30 [Bacteroidales bacterium]MDD7559339.1 50S ribosomal protein L30 [Bacteroidales bacterium]MDY3100054.1 50S ribosomal protein L30 [Porphyromonas sp.]